MYGTAVVRTRSTLDLRLGLEGPGPFLLVPGPVDPSITAWDAGSFLIGLSGLCGLSCPGPNDWLNIVGPCSSLLVMTWVVIASL